MFMESTKLRRVIEKEVHHGRGEKKEKGWVMMGKMLAVKLSTSHYYIHGEALNLKGPHSSLEKERKAYLIYRESCSNSLDQEPLSIKAFP